MVLSGGFLSIVVVLSTTLGCVQLYVEILKLLAENGADLSVVIVERMTPAHAAAANGHIEVLRLLAENGADLNAIDNYDRTPVYMAAAEGHVEVIQLLADALGSRLEILKAIKDYACYYFLCYL